MEKMVIDAKMEANGYNEFVCDLFTNWEYVKDEMLVPERKAGKGNGTVHVYLQQNNMDALAKCFSHYISCYRRGQNIEDHECPPVTHYCQVSNLVALASSTYLYYNCNDLIFNLVEYLKELLAYEEDGLFKFESVFKLSTSERPYFKQFSKKLFTRIIRSLFIGGKSAYKISLYRNSKTGDVATFWVIGHSFKPEYFISPDQIIYFEDGPEEKILEPKLQQNLCDVELRNTERLSNKDQFALFLKSQGKKDTTINNYIRVLNTTLPRLIRKNMELDCDSLFNTSDYSYLIDLEKKLWKCGPIHEYNISGDNQLSAAIHQYQSYVLSLLSDDELGRLLFS